MQSAVQQERIDLGTAIEQYLPHRLASIAAGYACTRAVTGTPVCEFDDDIMHMVSDADQKYFICHTAAANSHGHALLIKRGFSNSSEEYWIGDFFAEYSVVKSTDSLRDKTLLITKDEAKFDCSQVSLKSRAVSFGMCSDGDGNYYVHMSNGQIGVFDHGTLALTRIIGHVSGERAFGDVTDMVFDRKSNLLIVADRARSSVDTTNATVNRLIWATREGKLVHRIALDENSIKLNFLALHGPFLYVVNGRDVWLTCRVHDRVSGDLLSQFTANPHAAGVLKSVCVVEDRLCALFSKRVVCYGQFLPWERV